MVFFIRTARCGARTHDSIMRLELKSSALTTRPTWLLIVFDLLGAIVSLLLSEESFVELFV